jgi:RNA polymerase subunit RPABC4/transcription elongation factor Spt4
MSLISCLECNYQISDKASACPQCGSPIADATTITNACNRTVKPVTRFAIKPAKPAPALPAVEAGVMWKRSRSGYLQS